MVPIETEMGRKGHLALSTSTAEVSERLSSFQEAVSIYMFLGVEIRILSSEMDCSSDGTVKRK